MSEIFENLKGLFHHKSVMDQITQMDLYFKVTLEDDVLAVKMSFHGDKVTESGSIENAITELHKKYWDLGCEVISVQMISYKEYIKMKKSFPESGTETFML